MNPLKPVNKLRGLPSKNFGWPKHAWSSMSLQPDMLNWHLPKAQIALPANNNIGVSMPTAIAAYRPFHKFLKREGYSYSRAAGLGLARNAIVLLYVSNQGHRSVPELLSFSPNLQAIKIRVLRPESQVGRADSRGVMARSER